MELVGKPYITPNVSRVERGASIIAGSLLAYYGARKRSVLGAGMVVMGAAFLRRGVTGWCYTYQALGIRTADVGQGENVSVPYELGVRVDKSVTINKPRAEVFRFWRDLENLPRFMKHLKSVRVLDEKRSHWIAVGPGGKDVEWDAEIINEVENELIAWRSLPGSRVQNAGSVRFIDAGGDRGTEVRIALQYNPPGGILGSFYAKWFGEEPEQQISEDLRRLKAMLEAGQVANNTGQVSGRVDEFSQRAERKRAEEEKTRQASEESFPASDAPAYR
jgi:uncharacterized membrane protein